jgi:hypothetical protein
MKPAGRAFSHSLQRGEHVVRARDDEIDDHRRAARGAAKVPLSQVSAAVVPMNGISRCVCGSMPPGMM